jgi:hypothetical protein
MNPLQVERENNLTIIQSCCEELLRARISMECEEKRGQALRALGWIEGYLIAQAALQAGLSLADARSGVREGCQYRPSVPAAADPVFPFPSTQPATRRPKTIR